MALIGPGCDYIPYELEVHPTNNHGDSVSSEERFHVVNRNLLNNIDHEDTTKANDEIVPPNLLKMAEKYYGEPIIQHAKEGEAVILLGKGWEDKHVLSAVHRSPKMKEGEERILLVVDAVNWDYE